MLEIERSRLLATQHKMQEAATQAVSGGGESNEPKVDSQWLQVLQTRKKVSMKDRCMEGLLFIARRYWNRKEFVINRSKSSVREGQQPHRIG